jgi:hypothetical protein
VQDQLRSIQQQLLETVHIAPEKCWGEGSSTSPIGEVRTTNPFLYELAVGHRVLKIETDAVEFLTPELQEHMKMLSHMNVLVS